MTVEESNGLCKKLEDVQKYCKEHTSLNEEGSRICDKDCIFRIDTWCRWSLALSKNPTSWCLYHVENLK